MRDKLRKREAKMTTFMQTRTICDECLQKETRRAEKMDGGRMFA